MKYFLILLMLLDSSAVFAQSLSADPSLPDSWGIFEFIHFRTDETKRKLATDLIEQMMVYDILQDTNVITGKMKPSPYNPNVNEGTYLILVTYKKIGLLYKNDAPGDIYRTAVQRVLNRKDELRAQYTPIESGFTKEHNDQLFNTMFNGFVDNFYKAGDPPATFVIDSVEKRHAKENEDLNGKPFTGHL